MLSRAPVVITFCHIGISHLSAGVVGNFILCADSNAVGNRGSHAEVGLPRADDIIIVVGRQIGITIIIHIITIGVHQTIRRTNHIRCGTFQRIERRRGDAQAQSQRIVDHRAHNKSEFCVNARTDNVFHDIELVSTLHVGISSFPKFLASALARIFFVLHSRVIVHIVQPEIHTEIELFAEVEGHIEVIGLITAPLYLSVVVCFRISRGVADQFFGVGRKSFVNQTSISCAVDQRNGISAISAVRKIQRLIAFNGSCQLRELQSLRHQPGNVDIVERGQLSIVLGLAVVETKAHEAHTTTLQR